VLPSGMRIASHNLMENMLIGKKLFDQTVAFLQKSLDVRSSRHKVLSENVANADTPEYRAHDLPFQKILEQSAGNPTGLPLRKTHRDHILESDEGGMRRTELSNPDGVDIDQEMARLAENTVMFQAGVQALIKKLEALRAAITESK
jgi:flagellar basal-body rod protein FlgB